MTRLALSLIAVFSAISAFAGELIVAAEQAGRRWVVIDPAKSEGYEWEWAPAADPVVKSKAGWFNNPSEVKPVTVGNRAKLLVTASGGGFAQIDMLEKKVDFFGTAGKLKPYPNPHSIELIPGGVVAVASSTGGAVELISVKDAKLEPAKQRRSKALELKEAHGVVWLAHHNRLWAIGQNELVECRVDADNLTLEVISRRNFTEAGCGEWGHDLTRTGDGYLVFTTHDAVGKCDPETGRIELLEKRPAVKSFDFGENGAENLYCIPRERWWTDTLMAGTNEVVRKGAKFYKARRLGEYWNRPDDRLMFADPYILFEKGVYYAYGTYSGEGIAVATSKDLVHWKLGVGKAQKNLAMYRDDVYGERHFWAPEVYRRKDGKYVMVYSGDTCVCAAVADSPLGPFVNAEKKPVLEGNDKIDNSIFVDGDGRAWMVYVCWNSDGLDLIEMDKDLMHPKAGAKPVHLFGSDPGTWERRVSGCHTCEGPFILKHGGLYYITYSCNDYKNPAYALGVATAKKITGPWKKCAKTNPMLLRKAGLYGTGHHSFFRDAKGNLKIVFHAHTDKTQYEFRKMYIASARFVEKSGERTIVIDDDVISCVKEQEEVK